MRFTELQPQKMVKKGIGGENLKEREDLEIKTHGTKTRSIPLRVMT